MTHKIPLIGTSWKMNKLRSEAKEFATALNASCVWHNQVLGGCHPLLNENIETDRYRNGAACTRLQSQARYKHPWHQPVDGGNEDVNALLVVFISPDDQVTAQSPKTSFISRR